MQGPIKILKSLEIAAVDVINSLYKLLIVKPGAPESKEHKVLRPYMIKCH